jgi:hypothetical protein
LIEAVVDEVAVEEVAGSQRRSNAVRERRSKLI